MFVLQKLSSAVAPGNADAVQSSVLKKSRHMTLMLLAIIVAFLTLTLPLNLYMSVNANQMQVIDLEGPGNNWGSDKALVLKC